MNKNNKIGLVAFAVALFLLASYMGWLPFTLTGYCPAGVDANGACIPRNCASDDIQCKANNVRNLCMSTLDTKCPDIRTQTILNFGYVSNAALYGCTDPAFRAKQTFAMCNTNRHSQQPQPRQLQPQRHIRHTLQPRPFNNHRILSTNPKIKESYFL